MSDKHLSTQFDAELSGISTRVMEMGGLVESQIRQAVYALSQFNVEVADQVAATEVRVNTMEVDIDREVSGILASGAFLSDPVASTNRPETIGIQMARDSSG